MSDRSKQPDLSSTQPELSPAEVEALARQIGCSEDQIRQIVSLVGWLGA